MAAIRVTHLEVGDVGNLKLRIPVVTIGRGKPKLAILCGLHGDETASFIIARDFLRKISRTGLLRGSISILTGVNSSALATRTRVALADFQDLNRLGQGKADGTLTERTAHVAYDFLSDFSFVIDIHEFVMQTPTLAIHISSSEPEIDKLILKAIGAFSPTFVWSIKLREPEEAKYAGSLLGALIEHGVPGIALETSRLVELDSDAILRASEGLCEVAKLLGILRGSPRRSTPRAFVRDSISSSFAGIWEPKKDLMRQVRAHDTIGTITIVEFTHEMTVEAGVEGILLQIMSRSFVDTGTSIFAVGTKDPETTEKLLLLKGRVLAVTGLR